MYDIEQALLFMFVSFFILQFLSSTDVNCCSFVKLNQLH